MNGSDNSLLSLPVSAMLNSNVAVLDQYQTAAEAIDAMKEHSTRSVMVSNSKKEVIGLVSKTDVLYKVMSMHKSPAKVILEQIMSAPIISVPPETTIGDTLRMMEKHVIRQVVVLDGDSNIYGIVSRDDIITKMEQALIETVKVAKMYSPVFVMSPFASTSLTSKKSTLICPHCKTEYEDKELLSKHVKAIHPTK